MDSSQSSAEQRGPGWHHRNIPATTAQQSLLARPGRRLTAGTRGHTAHCCTVTGDDVSPVYQNRDG